MSDVALVFGATGGIGSALVAALEADGRFDRVIGLSRTGPVRFDLTNEASIEEAVSARANEGTIRLAIDATGVLKDDLTAPEKSLRDLDADRLHHAFAINAIGPALIMKHLLPQLPREGRAVFATLSAKVGSIGDNQLGGWYGYRAAKAALNQLVRTASIELKRRAPDAICVALHPGTVATRLSQPFAKAGLDVHAPDEAAQHLLSVIEELTPAETGGFFDWRGQPLPW